MFVTSQDDVRCHEPTTISQKEQSGDRRGTGKKDSTAPHNVRQLLKTTIVSLSAMAIMLGTRGQNMSITGKVLLLYSTTVLLFLVAVFVAYANVRRRLYVDVHIYVYICMWMCLCAVFMCLCVFVDIYAYPVITYLPILTFHIM